MTKIYLTIHELAERWGISAKALAQWRWHGKGPQYHKLEGHILYAIKDVEEFEQNCRRHSTTDNPQLINQLENSWKKFPNLSNSKR